MPRENKKAPLLWSIVRSNGENEIDKILFNRSWTITSEDKSLPKVLSQVKWTFNDDFWIRVTTHPKANPNISQQLDRSNHHPFLKPQHDAHLENYDLPEPQLNNPQLQFYGSFI